MFKLKTIALAALFALAIVGFVAMRAPAGPQGIAPTQVDVIDLMSKAGDLPVESAPAI
jgi:hypothetical protein